MASSPFKDFKIEEISQIDNGSLALLINRAIHQAFLDCDNRPGLKTARVVSLNIKLVPVTVDGSNRLSKVDVDFEVGRSMPKQGVKVGMKPGDQGLEFVPECPDNPDQRPLPFNDGDK